MPLQDARAQDPFGQDDAAGDPFGGSADDIFGSDPFDAGGSVAPSADVGAGQGDFITADPLALSLLREQYTDPARRLSAIMTLYNLNEPAAARVLLGQLGTPPTDEPALDLVRSLGSGPLLELMARPGFPAAAKQYLTQTMESAFAYATSEAQVQASIDQLVGNDPDDYPTAIEQLKVAGLDAGGLILTKIQEYLTAGNLDDGGLRRLLGVVQSGSKQWDLALRSAANSNSPIQSAAVLALAVRFQDGNNAAVVLAKQYETDGDASLAGVYDEWNQQFQRDYGFSPTDRTKATIWVKHQLGLHEEYMKQLASYPGALPVWRDRIWLWQPESSAFVMLVPDRFEVPTRNHSNWATALVRIAPNSSEAVDEYLVSQLQRAKVANGIDFPLPSTASELVQQFADSARLNQLLKQELKRENWIAAQALLETLRTAGNADLLQMDNQRHAPVVKALTAADARTRFEAVHTILHWMPESRFAGSSYFNLALAELLNSTVGAEVLVLSANSSDANLLNSMARSDGWESQVATDPTEMFRLLNEQPISMIIMTDATGTEPYVSVMDRIRELPQGKNLPIALVVRPENYDTAVDMFRVDRMDRNTVVTNFGEPNQALGRFLGEASRMADNTDLPINVRQRKTFDALQMLNQWLDDDAIIKNVDLSKIGPAAANLAMTPELGQSAASVLAHHGYPASQQLLAQIAGNSSHSGKARSAAALAFRESVRRYGILMTTRQIKAQYDRQNQTEVESPFSQGILNSILDTIEARHKQRSFDELPAIPQAQ